MNTWLCPHLVAPMHFCSRKNALLFNNIVAITAAIIMMFSKRVQSFEMILVGRLLYGINAGTCPSALVQDVVCWFWAHLSSWGWRPREHVQDARAFNPSNYWVLKPATLWSSSASLNSFIRWVWPPASTSNVWPTNAIGTERLGNFGFCPHSFTCSCPWCWSAAGRDVHINAASAFMECMSLLKVFPIAETLGDIILYGLLITLMLTGLLTWNERCEFYWELNVWISFSALSHVSLMIALPGINTMLAEM